ncbi:MAG: hypothetical protein NVSMB14_07780 [Isosphaeraceae bacterium]
MSSLAPAAPLSDLNGDTIATASPSKKRPTVERLAYRLDEIAQMLGVSRRTLQRERSAGKFPKSDVRICSTLLWSRSSLDAYVKQGGRGR